ncbi:hypothetical protein BDCR2A_00918 [Borrelia duttonii CR2A]|uniref:Uncharacterized protein n=1 Tax=Borrelia duttonii CR2A TaxID=1432657 RepID=W6TJG8_9SPIR|nr:hypothetical protein BDCR2A_00918 [Borrelia duttonii CR2A]
MNGIFGRLFENAFNIDIQKNVDIMTLIAIYSTFFMINIAVVTSLGEEFLFFQNN